MFESLKLNISSYISETKLLLNTVKAVYNPDTPTGMTRDLGCYKTTVKPLQGTSAGGMASWLRSA